MSEQQQRPSMLHQLLSWLFGERSLTEAKVRAIVREEIAREVAAAKVALAHEDAR